MTEAVPPVDDADREFITRLQKLDEAIFAGREYMEWEADYLDLEKRCQKSFSNWLLKKGVSDDLAKDFSLDMQKLTYFQKVCKVLR